VNDNIELESGIDIEKRINARHQAVNVLKDTILRSNLKNANDISENSAFFQIHYHLPHFNILSGIRYTYNSVSGKNVSGRITAVASINSANSVKAIWGQSFRAPTMLELYFDHPTVIGNRNLQPETANTYELAYVYGHGSTFFQALTYYNKLEHLIQRVTLPSGPPSIYQNVDKFEGCGVEFEGKYLNPKVVNLFVNYNYMTGIGNSAKLNYQLVPKHTIKAGFNKSIGNCFFSTNAYAISSVMGNPKLHQTLNPQYMADVSVGYRHHSKNKKINFCHTLSAKNITNAQMLIPEYIRLTDNINSQATTANGIRIIYILLISL
jgi:iron complex outermembrane receptor protein